MDVCLSLVSASLEEAMMITAKAMTPIAESATPGFLSKYSKKFMIIMPAWVSYDFQSLRRCIRTSKGNKQLTLYS